MSTKNAFENEIKVISKAVDAAPFEDRSFYYEWMCQQFYLVQQSTRYVALSASLVDVEDSKGFREWIHHLNEEVDHDKTLLKDIKALGYSEVQPIRPETRGLIGAQYYDIQKNGPNALLGYALLLEGLSCDQCAKVAERVQKAHGLRSSYLHLHAEVDQEHFPEGMAKLQEFPKDQLQVIESNLTMASSMYQTLLSHLVAEHAQQGDGAIAA